uniref:Saposin B-type domain-containing protein n=1 Tax=Acrobeloides nanus TaxID=290746 RepID=A0A914CMU0_9BILA
MYKFAILVALAVFTVASAQQPNEHDCRICEFIIAIARHHFHNNITDEAALKAQLLAECGHISNSTDQATCKTIVNNNIDKIYADLKAGDRSGQTCVDINYCTPAETGFPHFTGSRPTFAPKVRARRQAGTSPSPQQVCHLCDRLIAFGEYFLHKNPNATQAQLQAELENDCTKNPAEQQQCTAFVDANIATIYSDLKAGKRPRQVCTDLGVCAAGTSAMPVDKKVRARRQAGTTPSPQQVCHLCDKLIGYGEYFLHKNPNATQAQLQADLEHECSRDPAEQQQCTAFVDANIATIYSDLKAGKRPHQVCADLGVCPSGATSAMPVDKKVRARRQAATTESPQHVCHLCDRLISLGEHFLHKNPNATQAQLQAELEHDCTRDPPDQQHCTTFVDANIAKIYSDLKAGKRPYQVCADLGVCAAGTSAMPFYKKLMRNLN